VSVQLRGGHATEDRRLDRIPPKDWRHYERYPLTAATAPAYPMPVVLGINWYAAFDNPERDSQRRWWIGRGDLGRVRGGHAICVEPHSFRTRDADTWHVFYDQGQEGACVGFAESRMMSLLNRHRYDAKWLYWEAQRTDPWPGGSYPGADPQYEGTDVRAGLEILRTAGHRRVIVNEVAPPAQREGITAYRWLRTAGEALEVLGSKTDAIVLLNSWGRSYPERVWMPADTLARLLAEDGEAAVVTDQ
jgi:hypothetical protein